jgi:hypothetical protein
VIPVVVGDEHEADALERLTAAGRGRNAGIGWIARGTEIGIGENAEAGGLDEDGAVADHGEFHKASFGRLLKAEGFM